jgi:hypothetical protein
MVDLADGASTADVLSVTKSFADCALVIREAPVGNMTFLVTL